MSRIFPQALFAFIVALVIISNPTHALAASSGAGGACPTGANYLSLSSPQDGGGSGSVTLSSLGITNCFYVAANGADTNAGTSESSPWLHSPGMPSCASNCSSATINSGTGIIFRGGDTWHKSSGTPGMGGSFSFSTSGSSVTSPIYFGFDITWFSGSPFTRPAFSEDNPFSTGRPSSCSFNDDGATFINFGNTTNVIFDNFDINGDCASGSGSASILHPGNADVYERIYIHGWTFATSASGDTRYRIGSNGTDGSRYLFIVIDGSDSTFGTTCTNSSCVTPSGGGFVANGAAGWAMEDCNDVEFSIIRHVSNQECVSISVAHDNLYEFMFEPTIGGQHGNISETLAPGNQCVNFFFYNNIVRNDNEGVGIWPECGTDANNNASSFFYFNNVFENSGHIFGSPLCCDPNVVMASPSCNAGGCSNSGLVSFYFFNNDIDYTVNGRAGPSNATTPNWASGSTATFQNNHMMGQTSPITSWFGCNGSGNTCTLTDNGNEVFQSTSTATSQGYLLASDYETTSSSGATVGVGANLTSTLCNTLAGTTAVPSGAATECAQATGRSVSEVSQWGGQFASYPAIAVNARPSSGPWDVGAYQFTAGTTVAPPTGLNAVVQ